ncbi:MAG: hypothetical protein Fur002_25070 [Anaerolineales bacterium]
MRFNLFNMSDVPKKYHSNFIHFYFDIAWFGVLSGTAVNFLNVYVTRLGANGFQIGLLAAMSAVVNLFLAIPAARWLQSRPTGKAVFWASVVFRAGYLFWIPLPWLPDAQRQVWMFIALSFLMAIPLTPLGVGFNALFAESVPERYRAQVAATRNVTFAIAFMATSFAAGYILERIAFPTGYQIIFAIGAFGAAMSSYHLYRIRPLEEARRVSPLVDSALPKESQPETIQTLLRLDIWQTPFRSTLLALFFFHFSHLAAAPIYQIYNVNVLHLNDSHIGNGTALYYLAVLLGSTQFRKAAQRYGNKNVTGVGVAGMSFYVFALAAARSPLHFYLLSFFGGFVWALVNGAYANYLLEKIPARDRPSHLAWYNIALNFAILSSSLIGPAIANWSGLTAALIVFGVMRLLAGWFIVKHG